MHTGNAVRAAAAVGRPLLGLAIVLAFLAPARAQDGKKGPPRIAPKKKVEKKASPEATKAQAEVKRLHAELAKLHKQMREKMVELRKARVAAFKAGGGKAAGKGYRHAFQGRFARHGGHRGWHRHHGWHAWGPHGRHAWAGGRFGWHHGFARHGWHHGGPWAAGFRHHGWHRGGPWAANFGHHGWHHRGARRPAAGAATGTVEQRLDRLLKEIEQLRREVGKK